MIIIFKITDYFPETNQLAVKFCNEKSSKPIDEYSALAVGLKISIHLMWRVFLKG